MRANSFIQRAIAAAILTVPAAARAAPGLGEEVYGATVEAREPELELRFGRLTGGAGDGADALNFEAAFAPSDRLRLAALAEFERDPGGPRRARMIGVEAITPLGRIGGIAVATYAEYAIGRGQPDSAEAKLLLQRRAGRWDARLNLIGEKPLTPGAPLALGYAASLDARIAGGLRLGAAAFGELGTFHRFAPRAAHYAGPVVKAALAHPGGHDLRLEGGYLFALSAARARGPGQVRLNLEIEL